jgi:hypothetical protein
MSTFPEKNKNKDQPNHSHNHHTNESTHEFNPTLLFDWFNKSLKKTDESLNDFDDIGIKEYIEAYKEINKFLHCLGTIFYFVITDVQEKIRILENFLEKDPNAFKTILTAVKHEKSLKKLEPPASTHEVNCARTVLRLHRALIFVYKFLDNLFNAEPKCKSSHICTEVYEATLGKHHSWLVRKAANLGMHALPRREALLSHMCRNEEDHAFFPIFIKTVEKVYNITQGIYEKYDILNLP